MPLLAPNDGGIRYGARYLLPAIAMLAILAVVVVHRLCGGWGRRGFQVALAAGVVLSVVVEVRGVELLYHKKVFGRDFTAALVASPPERTAITYWWIPFEAPQACWPRRSTTSSSPAARWIICSPARGRRGIRRVNVVVLGKKDFFPLTVVPGANVVKPTHVVHPFDTYFNVTIFTLHPGPRWGPEGGCLDRRVKCVPIIRCGPSASPGATMRIVVNGQDREFSAAITLAQLLEGLAMEPRRVAVELNRRIVPRSRYAATPLADRDELEIVTLVGGG